jgi:hypothetical protein
MSRAAYSIGDIVILKDNPLRAARADGGFKILGILPEVNGNVQYRVRSESEGFDRRISSDDIDAASSAAPEVTAIKASSGAKEPWFKPSAIKVSK